MQTGDNLILHFDVLDFHNVYVSLSKTQKYLQPSFVCFPGLYMINLKVLEKDCFAFPRYGIREGEYSFKAI